MPVTDGSRRPAWLRKEKRLTPELLRHMARIKGLGLHTICESGRCPNISECMARGLATFLILGDRCTRDCGFCAVDHGPPLPPDTGEGKRIGAYLSEEGLGYAVITSVTRDDLSDGGAGHFALVVSDVKLLSASTALELLVPDFGGDMAAVDLAASLPIEVFGHNVETVESLYPAARKGADYRRSLAVLERAASRAPGGVTVKSGVMVGLGESREELEKLFRDLAGAGVRELTIGQYLRPGLKNLPVVEYVEPLGFESLEKAALEAGIPVVTSGPYVRSSFAAGKRFDKGRDGKYNSL
jgi:lipoic acid synthetase